MYDQVEKSKDNKSRPQAGSIIREKNEGQGFEMIDNRKSINTKQLVEQNGTSKTNADYQDSNAIVQRIEIIQRQKWKAGDLCIVTVTGPTIRYNDEVIVTGDKNIPQGFVVVKRISDGKEGVANEDDLQLKVQSASTDEEASPVESANRDLCPACSHPRELVKRLLRPSEVTGSKGHSIIPQSVLKKIPEWVSKKGIEEGLAVQAQKYDLEAKLTAAMSLGKGGIMGSTFVDAEKQCRECEEFQGDLGLGARHQIAVNFAREMRVKYSTCDEVCERFVGKQFKGNLREIIMIHAVRCIDHVLLSLSQSKAPAIRAGEEDDGQAWEPDMKRFSEICELARGELIDFVIALSNTLPSQDELRRLNQMLVMEAMNPMDLRLRKAGESQESLSEPNSGNLAAAAAASSGVVSSAPQEKTVGPVKFTSVRNLLDLVQAVVGGQKAQLKASIQKFKIDDNQLSLETCGTEVKDVYEQNDLPIDIKIYQAAKKGTVIFNVKLTH